MKPGIYDLSAAEYHADPADEPSLSAHIAHTLCSRSPKHAWASHPRLNPDHERVDEQKFDVGTASHALLLAGETICHVVEAADWRTKAAQEVRDHARADGLIPLLTHQWENVQAMVTSVREQLDALTIDPPLITDGKCEQTLVWEEQGVTCRALVDWLRDDHAAIDDLKTTGASADPLEWTRRTMWAIGADIQAAFYMRGVKALHGEDALFRYVVVETSPPYALSVVSLAPSALEHANEKIDHALATWRRCLDSGEWPAYPTQVAYAELPAWESMRWTEARYIEEEGARAA